MHALQVTAVDKSAGTAMSVLQLGDAISQHYGSEATAQRVLPLLSPLLISPSLSTQQFSAFIKAIHGMLERIQAKRVSASDAGEAYAGMPSTTAPAVFQPNSTGSNAVSQGAKSPIANTVAPSPWDHPISKGPASAPSAGATASWMPTPMTSTPTSLPTPSTSLPAAPVTAASWTAAPPAQAAAGVSRVAGGLGTGPAPDIFSSGISTGPAVLGSFDNLSVSGTAVNNGLSGKSSTGTGSGPSTPSWSSAVSTSYGGIAAGGLPSSVTSLGNDDMFKSLSALSQPVSSGTGVGSSQPSWNQPGGSVNGVLGATAVGQAVKQAPSLALKPPPSARTSISGSGAGGSGDLFSGLAMTSTGTGNTPSAAPAGSFDPFGTLSSGNAAGTASIISDPFAALAAAGGAGGGSSNALPSSSSSSMGGTTVGSMGSAKGPDPFAGLGVGSSSLPMNALRKPQQQTHPTQQQQQQLQGGGGWSNTGGSFI